MRWNLLCSPESNTGSWYFWRPRWPEGLGHRGGNLGRRSLTGGVRPQGHTRIRFDFRIDGTRFRPSLLWVPNEANLRRARAKLKHIKTQIALGVFSFEEEFPDFRSRQTPLPTPRSPTCSEVFDAFLQHCEARVSRGDLAPRTVISHRQILNRVWIPRLGRVRFLTIRHSTLANIVDSQDWSKKTYNNVVSTIRRAFEYGYRDHPEQRNPASFLKNARIRRTDRPIIDPFPIEEAELLIAAVHADWGEAQGNYDECRFFTGLRPSEEIALRVSDFDEKHGTLSVTKARVQGIERTTKTGESRLIRLCPRAHAVIRRQLQLREELSHRGILSHDYLFFDQDGAPLEKIHRAYKRWRTTYQKLPFRYRKPYAARHSSISWNLMTGHNLLWVAQQHGHSLITTLTVYAAWTEGALETNVASIRNSMQSDPSQGSITPSSAALQHLHQFLNQQRQVLPGAHFGR